MEVYLDNSATTVCDTEVADLVYKILTKDYGNPSSLHTKGVEAERYVREAARRIAATLRCRTKELIFTSGGTESDNLALIGCARAHRRQGNKIITSPIEHHAVSRTLEYLREKEGFDVVELPADAEGKVDLEAFRRELDDQTILVSVMMVNNEIGTIEPVSEIAEILKERGSSALFHVDAIQAYGKLDIHPGQKGIDLLSVSGHKIHGPKGAGFLYVKDGTKILPICYGGGQQRGMRSGTLNVPGIAGLGLACEKICRDLERKRENLYLLKQWFCDQLQEMDGVRINTPKGRKSAPHILNASFTGIRSEVMLHALEEKGICVSSGSACASNHPRDNSTLKNLGYPPEITDSAIRFSFSFRTTREELEYTAEAIRQLIPLLRRYTRH